MKTKFLLPMLAMIVAVGMSFTTERPLTNPSMDYYLDNGVFIPLGQEVICGEPLTICRAQKVENGPVYVVYDAPAHGTEKDGSGEVIELWRD